MKRTREDDLDSEFDSSEAKKSTWRDDPLALHKSRASVSASLHSATLPSKQLVTQEYDREEWKARRYHYLAMDAYSRHRALVNHYLMFSGHGIEHFKRSTDKDRNDYTVLGEEHRFLWSEKDESDTWEKRLAKSYYDRLFKEYAICDLSRYKENKIALRWRVEKEVVDGKGQFACGHKHCGETKDLQSWEVNFNYVEHSQKKQALVKVRLCKECSEKLNFHHKRKLWKMKEKKKEKDGAGSSSSSSSSKKKHRKKKSKKEKKKKHRHRHKEDEWKEKEKEKDSGTESDEEDGSSGGEAGDDDRSSVWRQSAAATLEKSQEDEFEDYFKDMLL